MLHKKTNVTLSSNDSGSILLSQVLIIEKIFHYLLDRTEKIHIIISYLVKIPQKCELVTINIDETKFGKNFNNQDLH